MKSNPLDRQAIGSRLIVGVVSAGFVVAIFSDAIAARRPAPPPTPQASFVDELTGYDTSRWMKADGWVNGPPFANAWRADHVVHDGGNMTLRLDDVGDLGMPYSSGEYRTNGFHSYGCYEARFKPIKQSGVVTAFFTFAGPYDNGGNGRHNEIDIEFLGNDTRRVQLNFWTNDDRYRSNNAVLLDLGKDASLAASNYGFKWTSTGISWYIDGQLVHSVTTSRLKPTPKATDSLHKIMMNVWPVDETASLWAGTFAYPNAPLDAPYEWVRYDSASDCSFTFPNQAPTLTYPNT